MRGRHRLPARMRARGRGRAAGRAGCGALGPPAWVEDSWVDEHAGMERIASGGSGFSRALLPTGHSAIKSSRLKPRSEEHTSELQSLMSISYTVFCCTTTNY